MSDIRQAEGDQGNSGFADEWRRLAQDGDGPTDKVPQDPDGLERDPSQGDPAPGQASEPPASAEAAPKEPAAGDVSDDIWANAPEQYRKAYQAERARLEQSARSMSGRASKAEREAAELRARLLARQEPAPTERLQEQGGGAPAPDALTKVAEEYEEVAGPLVEELRNLRQTVSRLEQSNASAEEKQRAQDEVRQTEHLIAQEQQLADAHSDWKDVVVDPGFVEWVRSKPQFIKDGIARNGNGIVDGAESAEILSLFKIESGWKQAGTDPLAARRQRQLEGGRTVPAKTPGMVQAGQPDDYQSEWKRLAAEERRQRQRAT